MQPQATCSAILWIVGLIIVGGISMRPLQGSAQDTRWEHDMAAGAQAYQNGQETQAETFYRTALEALHDTGPEDPRLAVTLNTLAVLYHTQSKYAQAEPLYQRVLKLLEQTVGPDHPTLATTLNNLAVVTEAQDKYAEAAPLYQRALALMERTLGPDHPNLAVALDNYADLLRKMQREAEAENAATRAKTIWAKQKREPGGK